MSGGAECFQVLSSGAAAAATEEEDEEGAAVPLLRVRPMKHIGSDGLTQYFHFFFVMLLLDMSSSTQPMSSTPHGSTTSPFIVEEFYVNDDDRVPYVNLENEEKESEPPLSNATGNESEPQNESQPSKRKRAKVSEVWKDMLEPVKNMKTKCKHYHQVLSASGTTTHLKRHL
ncbi:uncharacterized protein LOC125497281 [Beta vulgaris subsp. vulgaris]|uniref:uncharacterized protein LOC125497281 n=1 Tax=Beta vulgaris subsp. vulgaris TaxID=3555 RepID=UPI002036E8A6|nr:uncharacterized protein LOC125497281 [Beta vulgaris subsp. vulgaris]